MPRSGAVLWSVIAERVLVARPLKHPVERELRIVLSVLRGEQSAAEAARRDGVSESSIGKCKDQFLERGRAGLAAAKERRGRLAKRPGCAARSTS